MTGGIVVSDTGPIRYLSLIDRADLAVLEYAAEKSLIDIPTAIEDLKKTNFYASPKLYESLLERDKFRRQRLGH